MSSTTNAFAQGTVLKVAYSMLALTGTVMVARTVLQVQKRKSLTLPDYFVFVSFAFYVTMCALYIGVSPYMRRVYGVLNGELDPYPEMEEETVIMTKMIFAAPCMFWSCLWSIKYSLLALYMRLLVGIPRVYTILWWVIVGFCVVTHILNYVLYFQSCGGTIPGFWNGGCSGEPAVMAQLRSLYFSFAADISTNIMIMALPIHLTWNLKMPRSKKISILLLFASGVVCILFSVLRVAQVASNAAKTEVRGQPLDPTWLAIWGIVECAIAVIIGCCPAFAILINAFRTKSRSYNNSEGYRRYAGNSRMTADGSVHLGKLRPGVNDSHWTEVHSSQEDLTKAHDGIMVTTTVQANATAMR